jgi:hypothetical protein
VSHRLALLAAVLVLPASVPLGGQPGALKGPGGPPRPLEVRFGGGPEGLLAVRAGTFSAAKDPRLGGHVLTAGDKETLTLEGPAPEDWRQPREVRALVRLRTDLAPASSATFTVAKKDAKAPGLQLTLSAQRGGTAVSCQVSHNGKPLHDLAALSAKLDWDSPFANGFTYYPRAYPLAEIRPGWPEDFRLRIEHDMASLPDVPDKWLSVRIELREGVVRFWLDDRLVARKAGPDVKAVGLTQIQLSPGVQLAGYEVTPWRVAPGFLPLRLEGHANARAFLGGAALKPGTLPPPSLARVGGVPFYIPAVNAEGNDHIDVGRSLYRQANLSGYMPSSEHRWVGSARRDPARIQLRIPNRPYDSLYLLAAASGAPDTVPLVTAMFYRPGAGFAERFESNIPLATAQAADAQAVPVTLADGKPAKLWVVRIPLDPSRLTAFADLDIVEVELTKKVHQFRSYPDPFIYGWHQGGPASGVHIYAASLRQTAVNFDLAPEKFGHVWTAPEVPAYTARLASRIDFPVLGKLIVRTRSSDGTEKTEQVKAINLRGWGKLNERLTLPVKLNGYHEVEVTLEHAGGKWTEKRSFVRLAPDTRAVRWTPGKGALFGYWSYHGGHHTPKAERHVELMTAAGARTSIGAAGKIAQHPLVKKHWAPVSAGAWEVAPQPWAAEEKPDPKKYAEYQKQVVVAFTKAREALPPELRPDHVYFFPEPHVSQRVTEGNFARYWNDAEPPLTADEKSRLRMFFVTAKCAAEAVRKQWPNLKILIPWGDPLFAVPLLRAGFPKNLIDGSGLDNPGFERLPEMQLHQICTHRLYELRREFARAGIKSPVLQYCEGTFVPTEPGAVSPREQMDLYNRWTLLSMAYGVTRFYSGWFAFDCGNYYGSEHYGGCGIQRRIPYCDPKPAYAAYATMTDRLNEANFDGWLKTGSLTTYCLRFAGPKGKVHTLWTLRGKRPVTLTLAAEGEVHVTDAMNNTRVLKSQGKRVTVLTDPSVLYVSRCPEVVGVAVGEPDHGDARPAAGAQFVADLGDGSWKYSPKRDPVYERGTFAVMRYPGKFSAAPAPDLVHRKVLRSRLEKQAKVHELMPWYSTLTPQKPVVLPGAPAALGLWVKGASDWGRVVYVLRDAKGEKWTSIGTQDEYNCDDVHSWSAFNFDGWRYLRFELPGHTGSDNFRKHGTTWWRSDGGDGVVDLPLALEAIIVEQRTHVLYVNDVQPAASDTVHLGKLYVEHADPADATPEAVRLSRLRLPLPAGAPDLPNPIARLAKEGKAEPVAITKLEPPRQPNDGTAVHVHFKEAAGARKHFVWVGARADGRGAVNLTPGGAKSGVRIGGLRPAVPFYFWVSYEDAQGRPSRPSAAATATLKSTVPQP